MRVEVVYSPDPRTVEQVALELAAGSTVREAVRASGIAARHPAILADGQPVGIWGRLCGLDDPLRDGDRVELYRGLTVDPKEARRQRYRRQGGRTGRRAGGG